MISRSLRSGITRVGFFVALAILGQLTVAPGRSAANQPPIANADSATTPEDASVAIAVLANDSDPDGDPLFFRSFTPPTSGTVVLNADNTLTYTPQPNFSGTDTFTYTIGDGRGGRATATVTVTVTAVNDPPVAVNDSASTPEETPVIIAVLTNDSDVDGDTLSVSAVTQGANGTAVRNADNTVTYTPRLDFNGTDSFTYTITDNRGGSATATVTVGVTAVNDPPVAVNDSASTPEDTAVIIAVLTNDSDVDGDTLSVTGGTQGTNGTVVRNADNTLTYTPRPNFNGTDSFTYTIGDGRGGRATATVTVTVTAVNDPPVAMNDSAATPEDTAVTIGVLGNDSDVDGDALSVSAVTQGANGTVVRNGDNTATYTPNPNFNGTDTFTYAVMDNHGGSAIGTVTVTIGALNDPPVAVNDSASTPEDTAVTIAVLANDSDPDRDTLVVTSVTRPTAGGTVTINLDNTVTYTPALDFNGTDTFSYEIRDDNGGSATATVTVTVTAVNDPPVAVNEHTITRKNRPLTVWVLLNDSDPEGDPLVVTEVTQGSSGGRVVLNADGTVAYTPPSDFTGTDIFTYTITDDAGASATGTVTVTVSSIPFAMHFNSKSQAVEKLCDYRIISVGADLLKTTDQSGQTVFDPAVLDQAQSCGTKVGARLHEDTADILGPDTNGDGVGEGLDLAKFDTEISFFRGHIDSYINNGVIIAHLVIDEPHDCVNDWGGVCPTASEVDQASAKSKEYWPTLPTMVNTVPSYFYEPENVGFAFAHTDSIPFMYAYHKGDLTTFVNEAVNLHNHDPLLFRQRAWAMQANHGGCEVYTLGCEMTPTQVVEVATAMCGTGDGEWIGFAAYDEELLTQEMLDAIAQVLTICDAASP